MKISSLFPFAAFVLLAPLAIAEIRWTSDFEAAKKKAAEEGKDLLLDFTGSDWCHWCAKLKAEVFDQPAFEKGVADKFVLVEVDFPQDRARIDARTRAQNIKLARIHGVQGYPTIILADAQGRPYARTGYEPGGPEEYVKHLKSLQSLRQARDAGFSKAAGLNGLAKAKALQNALGDLGDDAVDEFYPEVAEQIVEADPKDLTGFSKGRAYRQATSAFDEQLAALFGRQQYEEVIAAADRFISRHKPAGIDKQRALLPKVMAYVELGNKEEAFKVMNAMKAAAPESELAGQLDGMRARIEVHLRDAQVTPGP